MPPMLSIPKPRLPPATFPPNPAWPPYPPALNPAWPPNPWLPPVFPRVSALCFGCALFTSIYFSSISTKRTVSTIDHVGIKKIGKKVIFWTYRLIMEHQVTTTQSSINSTVRFKGNESEPSRPTRCTVEHQSCIEHMSKLRKVVCKLFLRHVRCDPTHKDLFRLFLFLAGDCPLRIDLFQI